MKFTVSIICIGLMVVGLWSFQSTENKVITFFLIGDSTMADYPSYDEDYMGKRYPMTGWGQVFPQMVSENLWDLNIINKDSIKVDNRARGGRSTRTFFEEGRWSAVYKALKPGDMVLIQFGHNDAAESKPERYVSVEGYKEYLRLFISQTYDKGAKPVLITPVNRNYPWKDSKLLNSHEAYHLAATEIAEETGVILIDLTQLSLELFTEKGQDYVTQNYFMNLPPGKYGAYPDGLEDNTHFQPEGAAAVADLVIEALKSIR
ncbi:rhamnogalacturonan acetylesterase [Anditalea andensis]|uniref:GDSL family lipase n=1 Tax=Anditalea andensis TaxID=1048983 RepID=A0A074KWS7_9BACT|nr:rhamnogalacturonan acetylesterase [Anditalea andensis]KEO72645.1 GDSL family lipase [Anditalea andensis]